MSRAYYNEIDPYAAKWLRNLINAGHIASGDVDERDIKDVLPNDLAGYTQCHFFAGVGVWSYALRKAGWPDDRPVWTGSCPCQPFSSAGKGAGFADERHLWPSWHHLIRQLRPGTVFGEQVASADGLAWLDLVQADMEGEGYACGPVDLCAAGVGAPHIRQRLWFVADADKLIGKQGGEINGRRNPGSDAQPRTGLGGNGMPSLLGNAGNARLAQRTGESRVFVGPNGTGQGEAAERASLHACGLADSGQHNCRREAQATGYIRAEADRSADRTGGRGGASGARPGPTNGHWRDADWLCCRDGKWRPVEPCTFPLAHGATSRVGRLRAYGNAINAEAAEAVIRAHMERELAGYGEAA